MLSFLDREHSDRRRELLALARAAGGARDSPVDRAGVRVQRVQPSAVARDRRSRRPRRTTGSSARSAGCSASRSSFSGCRRRSSARGSSASVRARRCSSSALCFGGGFQVAALGVATHQFWLLLLGYGVLGGIGLGLGYISPVSTLIKWFPDRPGMATGLAIMGFGGGAMIASPLVDDADGALQDARRRRASRRRSSRWASSTSRS